eukprot:766558-Hanusia_phi.AAC.2
MGNTFLAQWHLNPPAPRPGWPQAVQTDSDFNLVKRHTLAMRLQCDATVRGSYRNFRRLTVRRRTPRGRARGAPPGPGGVVTLPGGAVGAAALSGLVRYDSDSERRHPAPDSDTESDWDAALRQYGH